MSASPARLVGRLSAKRLPILARPQRPFSSHSAKQADLQRQQITLSRSGEEKKWAGLSTTQKAGRAASTGANLLTIVVGVGLTVGFPICRVVVSLLSSDGLLSRVLYSRSSTLRFLHPTLRQIGSIASTRGSVTSRNVPTCWGMGGRSRRMGSQQVTDGRGIGRLR